MKLCLQKLGLQVNYEEQVVPSLSRLHLSAHQGSDVSDLISSWHEIITLIDGEEYVKGENDTFHFEKFGGAWAIGTLKKAVDAILPAKVTETEESNKDDEEEARSLRNQITENEENMSGDKIMDYDKVIKKIVTHEKELPSTRETPYFHHDSYYANLKHYHSKCGTEEPDFGNHLIYGEVVTSTNTLLEKYGSFNFLSYPCLNLTYLNRNPSLLRNLPQGFTMTATTQIAGRGRGSNVWIAPPGALMFSSVVHHPFQLTQSAPIIFIQYVAALAIVRGIKAYAPGYSKLPVRLKWPNDIYALNPTPRATGKNKEDYVKIGGILVNSSYSGSQFTAITGVGINVDNAAPTTSLNALAKREGLKAFQMERLLASILAAFEGLYREFCEDGWNRDLEEEYYDSWLHTYVQLSSSFPNPCLLSIMLIPFKETKS